MDYYNTLGVQKNANADEIESAYLKLAKKWHPDKHSTSSQAEKDQAEKKFKEVQHAYDVLSNGDKRAAYDRYGNEEGPQFNPHGGGFGGFGGGGGFGDIFSDIFSAFTGGGRTHGNTNTNQAGEDVDVTVHLTFKEAYAGVEKEVTYHRVEKCGTCKGMGSKNGTAHKTCTKCGGRGRVIAAQRTMLGMMQTERQCDMCSGLGRIITEPCSDCKGKARSKVQRTVKVKIPGGVDNDQMLTMRGEGHASGGNGANGNLILVFNVKGHPLFLRDGSDLKMDLPLPVADAVLGINIDIPTMTGMVNVNIPEGVQDGTIVRVKGRGFKVLGNKEAYGDLYVKIVLDVPKNLSSKQKTQLNDFREILKDAKYEKLEKYNKKLKDI
jgi:molecular chaperone DnaJ